MNERTNVRTNGTLEWAKEKERQKETKSKVKLWKSFSSEMAINILRHLINRQNGIKFYFRERARANAKESQFLKMLWKRNEPFEWTICAARASNRRAHIENCPNGSASAPAMQWKLEAVRVRGSKQYRKTIHNHKILMAPKILKMSIKITFKFTLMFVCVCVSRSYKIKRMRRIIAGKRYSQLQLQFKTN